MTNQQGIFSFVLLVAVKTLHYLRIFFDSRTKGPINPGSLNESITEHSTAEADHRKISVTKSNGAKTKTKAGTSKKRKVSRPQASPVEGTEDNKTKKERKKPKKPVKRRKDRDTDGETFNLDNISDSDELVKYVPDSYE